MHLTHCFSTFWYSQHNLDIHLCFAKHQNYIGELKFVVNVYLFVEI
jgi:hypothetical protein